MTPNSIYHQNSGLNSRVDIAVEHLLQRDPYLKPHKNIISRRLSKIITTEIRLTQDNIDLTDFASGHEYFGLHFQDNQWVFREWAPNAVKILLIGDMTTWQEKKDFALSRLGENDVWEIRLPSDRLKHKDLYRLRVYSGIEFSYCTNSNTCR